MRTPCYNTLCLNRHLREEDKQDKFDLAAEALSEDLYEEVEGAAKAHPLLEQFIDQQSDALNEFLEKQAREILKNEE